MITYQEIFFAFFRVLNFVILIWLFTHVFLKYFYQDCKVAAKRQLDWWLALRDNIMQMRIKQKELDATIAHEQWEVERLLDNLARWQVWVQKEQQLQKRQRNERDSRLRERYNIQEKHYQETVLARQSIPTLFIQAHDQLCQIYKDSDKKAHMFMDTTMSHIRVRHD